MKPATLSLILSLLPCLASAAPPGTTINTTDRLAYAANLGWIDCKGDVLHGAVIGRYVCSGSIYSANVGWISLGSGAPVNQIRYQNTSATDYGVNHDGAGHLRGYAYGANIGWINFGNSGAPTVDLLTGKLSGSFYSANCGWISLDTATAFVRTDSLYPGPLASNGLPVPWLIENFGTTAIDPLLDGDGDGQSNLQEYLAGTNPVGANGLLRITAYAFAPGGTAVSLTWDSVPTRFYRIWKSPALAPGSWTDSGLGLIPPTSFSTTSSFTDAASLRHFYRVEAVLPLQPPTPF